MRGDMAELVECARLEIVNTGNCIEGSNPPISAINIIEPGDYYGNTYPDCKTFRYKTKPKYN